MKSPDLVRILQSQRKDGPQAGQRWLHYKGDEYEVVCRSVDEVTLEHLVTYRSVALGHVWTRTLANWYELVNGQPRFRLIPPTVTLEDEEEASP